MKKIISFDLDGSPVYIEVEEVQETSAGFQRAGRDNEEKEKSENRFTDAIAKVKPVAEAVLKMFQEMHTPDEIGLDFGIKFNAKAGAVFASVDSEATFKVSLKWKNKKEG